MTKKTIKKKMMNKLKKLNYKYYLGIFVLGIILVFSFIFLLNKPEPEIVEKVYKTYTYKLEQPELYSQPLIIKTFKNTFSIKPVEAKENVQKVIDTQNKNKVRYIDAYQNTDVVQIRQNNKLKEDIILKQAGHPEEFIYQIDIESYDFEKDEENNLVFYKKGYLGKELYKLFTIPKPFMIEEKDLEQEDIGRVEMRVEGNKLILIPDKDWIKNHNYPIIVDPTIEINILNIHSHPQQGDDWVVEFTTQGQADLYIIPDDQATIDDDEFVALYCGEEEMTPQILENDVIYYPDWECLGIAKVVHYTLTAGNHILRFEFGDQIAYAYNSNIISLIDSLEYDTEYGRYSSLVMIDATHFILAYRGTNSYDAYIKTFSIDDNYDNITEIDSLNHDSADGPYTSLVMIDATHFILVYRGLDSDGYIKTFSIDDNYDNITEIDSLEHDTTFAAWPSLVMIDATHFMLAYESDTGTYQQKLKTFSIDSNYDNITEIDSLAIVSTYASSHSLVRIDATHFILASSYSGEDGYIKTLSIDGGYNITVIDTLRHDILYGMYNSLVMIDATHFILAYESWVNDSTHPGYISTFSIDGSYNITEIATLKHQDDDCKYNSMVMVDSTHFLVAHSDSGETGFLTMFTIDSNYQNITETYDLEYDTVKGTFQNLIKIDTFNYALSYSGPDDDGYFKTFRLISNEVSLDVDSVIIKKNIIFKKNVIFK